MKTNTCLGRREIYRNQLQIKTYSFEISAEHDANFEITNVKKYPAYITNTAVEKMLGIKETKHPRW